MAIQNPDSSHGRRLVVRLPNGDVVSLRGKMACTVLLLIQRGDNGLTSLEALRGGGGSRLASQIGRLKARGFPIDASWKVMPNGERLYRYRLATPVRILSGGDGNARR